MSLPLCPSLEAQPWLQHIDKTPSDRPIYAKNNISVTSALDGIHTWQMMFQGKQLATLYLCTVIRVIGRGNTYVGADQSAGWPIPSIAMPNVRCIVGFGRIDWESRSMLEIEWFMKQTPMM